MPKTINSKKKGDRFEKAKCHIPYYTAAALEPSKQDAEDGEEGTTPTVDLPIKIAANGGEHRFNVTSFKIKQICYFEDNVETVMEVFSQLDDKCLKPRALTGNEEWKIYLQLLHVVCADTATTTLQEVSRKARSLVYDEHFANNEDENANEDALKGSDVAFFEYVESEWDVVEDDYADSAAYTTYLFEEHRIAFFNTLYTIIFGADAHRAFNEQLDYLRHQIVKPFGVTVEAAFRRIDVLVKYMENFPPISPRGESATREHWRAHKDVKKIDDLVKRQMKYNLLPTSFHDRFDQSNEDYTVMTNAKFLSEAQKFELADAKDSQKMEAQREKLKRKKEADADSVSNLSRKQKDKSNSFKKARNEQKLTPKGEARHCVLCEMAGAPKWLYSNHNTENCRKKDEHRRNLSGGAGQRAKTTKEYRRSERKMRRELKSLQAQVKKAGIKTKKRRSDDSSISSVDSDDASY